MKIKTPYLLAFVVVLINSQIFRKSGANPIGLIGFQEVFYAILFVLSLTSVCSQYSRSGKVRTLDLFVLTSVIGLSLYSAIQASITFGQPIVYGLIEERRLYAFLIYFPVYHMLRNHWISEIKLEQYIVIVAKFSMLLTFAVYIGLIPEINSVSQNLSGFRSERYAIGHHFIGVALIIILIRSKAKIISFREIISSGLLLSTLVVLVQSRQIIGGVVASLMISLKTRRARLLTFIFFIFLISFSFLFYDLKLYLQNYALLFESSLSEAYLTQSWRALSIAVVLNSIGLDYMTGNGALWISWNEGFHRIHGEFFFLADIGIFGTIYRYGIVGLFVYIFYFRYQWRCLKNIESRQTKLLYSALFAMVIVAAPVSAPLEYRGFLSGFILAVTAYLANKKYVKKRNNCD